MDISRSILDRVPVYVLPEAGFNTIRVLSLGGLRWAIEDGLTVLIHLPITKEDTWQSISMPAIER